MELKKLEESFSVCKVEDYSMVNRDSTYCFIGKTDEENLGFTYAELDEYIRHGVTKNMETKARIDSLHHRNQFKIEPMPGFVYK